eukprot:scaffold73189_cov59-Phaeocystis_antarctica.AAC.3
MQERMISLNEHVLVPSRRRLLEMRGGLDEVLDTREAGNDVLGLSGHDDGPEDSTPGRRLAPGRRLLAGLYGRRLWEKSGAPGRRLKEVPLKEIRKTRAAAAEAEKKKASPRVERPPKTDKALLRGLGHASGQFGFVRDTGQVWRQHGPPPKLHARPATLCDRGGITHTVTSRAGGGGGHGSPRLVPQLLAVPAAPAGREGRGGRAAPAQSGLRQAARRRDRGAAPSFYPKPKPKPKPNPSSLTLTLTRRGTNC